MPPRKHVRKQRQQLLVRRLLVILGLVVVLALVIGGVVWLVKSMAGSPGDTPTPPDQPPEPQGPQVVSTATVGNSGDILIHSTVRRAHYNAQTQTFDFNKAFSFLKPYVTAADYAVVNAEFSVSTNSSYSALPFRVPTTVVEALKNCGYDMGLTANNHIADGGVAGIKKTMTTLKEYGMDYTGSRMTSDEARYLIKEVNGIKIGMLNYTYSSYWNTNGFSKDNLEAFYKDAGTLIGEMRQNGAELVYVYLHWGEEYSLTPNSTQTAMAQKLCDLGVDVIVGGHPHKIQPLELVTSTDGSHQTICLYSSGNLLSGQQVECMAGGTRANSPHCFQDAWHFPGCDYPDVADRTQDTHRLEHGPTCNDNGHTEDGLVLSVKASKYEDGTVMISSVDVLPVWCMGRGLKRASNPVNSSFEEYSLIPLDKSVDWVTTFGLTAAEKTEAEYSYNRTMALVGKGIETINAACKAKEQAFFEAFKAAGTTTAAQ